MDPETGLLLQTRPAIGGNVMATIKTPCAAPDGTVRPGPSGLGNGHPAGGAVIRPEIPPELFVSIGGQPGL